MFSRLFPLIAALALAGCGSGPARLPIDDLAASDKARVEDVRPGTEATGETFSRITTSERFGYARIAEDVTVPSGARLFAHRWQEKHGADGASVRLHHFVVYTNRRHEFKRHAAAGGFGGAVGSIIANATFKREGDAIHTLADPARFAAESGDNEYRRAIYTDPEIPAGTSVWVIYIDSESQQKRRFTRTVWPIKDHKPGEKIPLHQAMEAAIRFNLEQ
ncbi:hypothetical protein [Massilia sp. METH4]|uniref:hypothetical protein n=1 Tax=Massilia sp. METH4 TaxID=3123041 RepID=UPI0030CD7F25